MKTSLTQLLVHLDSSAHAAKRLRVACELARRRQATVTALYAATSSYLRLPLSPELGPTIESTLRELDEERRAQARALFDQTVASVDVRASWAALPRNFIVQAFAQQALYADLLVLGQHDASGTEAGDVPADFSESVLMISGKPALIMPYAVALPTLGETVVIAWKPTREAARAVAASMPLLQSAQRVHVVAWTGDDAPPAPLDLSGYLALHGVKATWHREGRQPDAVGELLLSRVFDLQADLLVMGCYGHSRVREWVLGGVSRTILQSMTLPVLMAH